MSDVNTPSPQSPSMLQALTPIIALVIMLSSAVIYFGDNSSYGPNQIALLIAMGIAIIIGLKNGHNWQSLEKAIISGISLSLGAILILLSVGALIGTWLLSGTVPTMIYYGLANFKSELVLCCSLYYMRYCLP